MKHGLFAVVVSLGFVLACGKDRSGPLHREHDAARDVQCKDAALPRAYFYPAANRTDYAPDHPTRDGCALLVADHLFCCPDVKRPTDR